MIIEKLTAHWRELRSSGLLRSEWW